MKTKTYRILVLDDERDYRPKYCHKHAALMFNCNASAVSITHVETVEDFRKVFDTENIKFDLIYLDHDLGTVETGFNAAEFLSLHISPPSWPEMVYVHTANTPAGVRMVAYLKSRGLKAIKINAW